MSDQSAIRNPQSAIPPSPRELAARCLIECRGSSRAAAERFLDTLTEDEVDALARVQRATATPERSTVCLGDVLAMLLAQIAERHQSLELDPKARAASRETNPADAPEPEAEPAA